MPKYILFLVALFWAGVIAYFCLVKSSDLPVVNIPGIDKCIHTFFHFVFTFVWFLFFRKQFKFKYDLKPLMLSLLFSFVFGILIEILQELFTITRHADVADVLANLTGAVLAVLSVLICNKFNVLKSILKN
ncbi:VanZ like protein [Flavobacterium sp. 1]|uniref:VanZ family protein n=1 Tax=Flavobacterium sp. 1 TaxID=2035200 RepID=UPI000C23A92C|nr:VanZ family protein [Flavobacterium sp. 1]PJJ09564.1 VanZ like protein [Flavobacterium sp. 1]